MYNNIKFEKRNEKKRPKMLWNERTIKRTFHFNFDN